MKESSVERWGLSEDDGHEVRKILGMFEVLLRTYSALTNPAGIIKRKVEFPGFDGNEEAPQLGYTQYLVAGGQFASLTRGIDDFNNHAPCLDRYREMLRRWEASADKDNLTVADLTRITA